MCPYSTFCAVQGGHTKLKGFMSLCWGTLLFLGEKMVYDYKYRSVGANMDTKQ
jgi:hypothetical protein